MVNREQHQETEGVRAQRGEELTGAEQDVACGGVPGDDAHPLGVPLQDHHRLLQRGDQAVLRYLPDLGTHRAHTLGQTIHRAGPRAPGATSNPINAAGK